MSEGSSTPAARIVGIILGIVLCGAIGVGLVEGGKWLSSKKGPLATKDDANKQYLETVRRIVDRGAKGATDSNKKVLISSMRAAASDIADVPTADVAIEVVAWGKENASLLKRMADVLERSSTDDPDFKALKREAKSNYEEGLRLAVKYGG